MIWKSSDDFAFVITEKAYATEDVLASAESSVPLSRASSRGLACTASARRNALASSLVSAALASHRSISLGRSQLHVRRSLHSPEFLIFSRLFEFFASTWYSTHVRSSNLLKDNKSILYCRSCVTGDNMLTIMRWRRRSFQPTVADRIAMTAR